MTELVASLKCILVFCGDGALMMIIDFSLNRVDDDDDYMYYCY